MVKRAKPLAPEVVKAAVQRAVDRPKMISKMQARPNWDDDTANNVGDEGVDRLHIPMEILQMLDREGIVLQWITRSVRGQETPQLVSTMTKGGWTPVHQSDFDGILDGMFMPKGVNDVIGIDDAMLVARPKQIHARAKQRERAMAKAPLQIKEQELGRGLDVPGGDHPTATAGNRINRSLERIDVPND